MRYGRHTYSYSEYSTAILYHDATMSIGAGVSLSTGALLILNGDIEANASLSVSVTGEKLVLPSFDILCVSGASGLANFSVDGSVTILPATSTQASCTAKYSGFSTINGRASMTNNVRFLYNDLPKENEPYTLINKAS